MISPRVGGVQLFDGHSGKAVGIALESSNGNASAGLEDEKEGCFVSVTRCHNIECATWATKLVCQVEVPGPANGLKKCIFRFYQEENNGFHLNEI